MDENINYTMENPTNTNPNVLRSMLENYSGGGGGGVLVTSPNPKTGALDKTWRQIDEAPLAVIRNPNSDGGHNLLFVIETFTGSGSVSIKAFGFDMGGNEIFILARADSPDGYPAPVI